MGSGSPYKLNSDGAYVALVLASGNFNVTDTLVLDGSKAMLVYYGPAGAGTELLTTAAPANGVIRTPLTGLPANQNSIYVYRTSSTYNGTLTYMEVRRPSTGGATPTPTTVAVTGVTLNKNTTSIEQGQTETLTATVAPDNATNKDLTWSSDSPAVATVDQTGKVTAVAEGTANITVTTTDGNKTATCAVTVTAPAAPIDVTGIALNKTATTIAIGDTETLTVSYTPSDANNNKGITWSSDNTTVATVDQTGKITAVAKGTATVTATTTNGKTATCSVTVQPVAVTGVSLSQTTANLQVNGTVTLAATVAPANATNKALTWASDNTAVATVDQTGKVTAVTAGTANITVTTTDGNKTAACAVTVTAGPSTTLTLHTPGVYEDHTAAGGYGKELELFQQREYEVYYAGRYDNGGTKLTIHVDPIDKSHGVTKNESSNAYEAQDGWFKGTGNDKGTGFAVQDEFKSASTRCHNMKSTNYVEMHIKGFDQFSLYGMDKKINLSKPADHKVFKVLIDSVEQTMTPSTSATIRRFEISTGEHVIRIQCGDDCLFGGFSLRVAQEPSIKWIKGNDSTQTVRATEPLTTPIMYQSKYGNLAGASIELQWIGTPATGITITSVAQQQGELRDTLAVKGVANCPAGTYQYAVVSTLNGVVTNRLLGKFTVVNDIRPTSDDTVLVYKEEEMDAITFRYYANDVADVQLSWPNGQPAGINGTGSNGKYSISGTPAQVGIFPFSVSIEGLDTVFYGQIEVKDAVYGDNAVLYLYKNNYAYSKDGIYNYLKSHNYTMVERKAKDGLRSADQYSKYKWIFISEDADANNPEVIALIRDGSSLPILNMKGFTYAKDSLRLGWGDPNNGAIDSAKVKKQGCFITIERSSHPIFKNLSNKADGKEIRILDDYAKNGIMPIAINNMPGNTTCLATAPTRGMDYYEAGAMQTAIHEIPASQRGGGKYICLPIARQVTLSPDGEKLLRGIIDYLLSPAQAAIEAPELRITKFTVEGIDAKIDEGNKTIKLELTVDKFRELDSLRATQPQITLADPVYSHVIPASGEEVNLKYSIFMGKEYVVTDYVNRVVYEFKVQLVNPQGIEETYEAGQWVNIYDIYGRKVTTTNEDIYTMDLPRGVYIVVTESGNTLKIMR